MSKNLKGRIWQEELGTIPPPQKKISMRCVCRTHRALGTSRMRNGRIMLPRRMKLELRRRKTRNLHRCVWRMTLKARKFSFWQWMSRLSYYIHPWRPQLCIIKPNWLSTTLPSLTLLIAMLHVMYGMRVKAAWQPTNLFLAFWIIYKAISNMTSIFCTVMVVPTKTEMLSWQMY